MPNSENMNRVRHSYETMLLSMVKDQNRDLKLFEMSLSLWLMDREADHDMNCIVTRAEARSEGCDGLLLEGQVGQCTS